MKKLFAVLAALLLLLCACTEDVETPPPEEPSSQTEEQPKEEKLKSFKDENGKYGIKKGDEIVIPAEYDEITLENGGIYNNTDPYNVAADDCFFVLTKYLGADAEHEKEIELLSSAGNFAEGGPFDELMVWGWYSDGHAEISVSKDYSVYGGTYSNGEFDFELVREALDPESTAFGYSIFSRHGVFHRESRGVKNADGEVIIPCTYDMIDIPFPNIAYCNKNCAQTLSEAQSEIFNLETGEIISNCYNFARIYTFEEGYFGVAYAAGGNPDWDEKPVYLPDGTPTPQGWRFINKNAKEVSGLYANFTVDDPNYTWKYEYTLDTVIIATDFEGNVTKFTVRDILIKK